MKGFLPEGYEVPKTGSGSYMKLKAGANKFRVLSAPILGFEYWTEDRKPVRARELWKVIPANADISGERGWNPKHFWAFVVWNFDEKAVQILELTQATIQRQLIELIHNEEWGDPRNYTITITRKGEKLDTEYSVVPSPAKPTPPEIIEAYKDMKIDLDALFDGGDPFKANERSEKLDGGEFPTTTKEAAAADFDEGDVPF
jgi:hypothetical protein